MLDNNTCSPTQKRDGSQLLSFCTNVIAIVAAGLITANAHAVQFDSGNKQVALVELFTSEGCSSCPPADATLSNLRSDRNLFKTFVPVAFHVDYWNRLGWDDRFADAWHSDRQYKLLALNGRKGGYTPNFVVDGREWKGFFKGDPVSVAINEGRADTPGRLLADVSNGQITAAFSPQNSISGHQIELHVAQLGMNFSTEVKAGENNGRILKHDFVVLEHETFPMNSSQGGYQISARLTPPTIQTNSPAVAIWVSTKEDLRPIQATGGLLTGN